MDNDKERVRLAEEIGIAKKSREAINIKYQFLLLLLQNLNWLIIGTVLNAFLQGLQLNPTCLGKQDW